ncbi:hypothetical protein J6590_101998 [Homalodisca vitripennis]|nr:hypothetical protein J6590_101998 [Homalodisca vitripennis]
MTNGFCLIVVPRAQQLVSRALLTPVIKGRGSRSKDERSCSGGSVAVWVRSFQ